MSGEWDGLSFPERGVSTTKVTSDFWRAARMNLIFWEMGRAKSRRMGHGDYRMYLHRFELDESSDCPESCPPVQRGYGRKSGGGSSGWAASWRSSVPSPFLKREQSKGVFLPIMTLMVMHILLHVWTPLTICPHIRRYLVCSIRKVPSKVIVLWSNRSWFYIYENPVICMHG